MNKVKITILFCLAFIFLYSGTAQCHVEPDSSSPKVGATVTTAPKEIKIWFDDYLEAAPSKIWVKNAEGVEVDQKNSHIDKKDPALLEVSLKDIPPGKYHVYWSAEAPDGHNTEGDYFFTYKKNK